MTALHPRAGDTARLALEISALLSEAENAQWAKSRIVLPDGAEDDPAIRSQGEHSDPTFDAVADPTRLALRDAVEAATRTLYLYQSSLSQAVTRLTDALDKWNGGA